MQKLEIELDQETFNKIKQLAQTHDCQISDLIKAISWAVWGVRSLGLI